jgi:hypothetical protein
MILFDVTIMMNLAYSKMKKVLLLSILIVLVGNSFSQSKHGFTTGLDYYALEHKIKSQTEFSIRLDSNSVDTSWHRIKSFNKNGFIVEISELDYANRQYLGQPIYNFLKKNVKFIYNDYGYLIHESYNWFGPRGSYGEDTVKKVLTQTWKMIENTEILESEVIHYKYPDDEYISTIQYYYRSDGKKSKTIKNTHFFPFGVSEIYQTITEYSYNENGLLMQVVTTYDSGNQSVLSYVYEYYE